MKVLQNNSIIFLNEINNLISGSNVRLTGFIESINYHNNSCIITDQDYKIYIRLPENNTNKLKKGELTQFFGVYYLNEDNSKLDIDEKCYLDSWLVRPVPTLKLDLYKKSIQILRNSIESL